MLNKDDKTVCITFEQLKNFNNYKPTTNNRFIDDIQHTYYHLISLCFGSCSTRDLNKKYFYVH